MKEFTDKEEFWKFVNASKRPDNVQQRLRELFTFEIHNESALRSLLNVHLQHLHRLVLYEIDSARSTKQSGSSSSSSSSSSSNSAPSPDSAIRCWIAVAQELVKLNNWHSLQGILSGLQNSLSKDNKQAWSKVANEDREWFIQIRRVFLSKEELKRKVLSLPSPCIPSVFVYLEWISELQKENGPVFVGDMINVKRMMAIGNAVLQFVRIQKVVPAFQEIRLMTEFFASRKPHSH